MSVRVRFAPSPTGYLHIGSARTALFNWLFAKHNKGTFILRIEDTDKQRSDKMYEIDIINSLKWLGLFWDEGPYNQSERIKIYQEYAEKLVKEGYAYKENYAIRFKVPQGKTIVKDLIRGEITFNNELIEDFVIMKSDGTPTYNFSCVIDDYLMQITHVIRGEDHIPNTAKQILIYNSLSIEPPQFAHIPLILGIDRTRLSKRHGATPLHEYIKEGYLPEAIINFIVLLGWSYDGEQQIFSKEELIEKFTIERISKNPAIFDIKKLDWFNGYYIRKLNIEKLVELSLAYFKQEYVNNYYEKIKKIVAIEQQRIKKLSELSQLTYFFEPINNYDEKGVEKFFKKNIKDVLQSFIQVLESIDEFTACNIEKATNEFILLNKIKLADLVHPVRLAITGLTQSPPIFDTMEIIGKYECIKRIKHAVYFIENHME
jgi:glutamyl-tRNA synthetase